MRAACNDVVVRGPVMHRRHFFRVLWGLCRQYNRNILLITPVIQFNTRGLIDFLVKIEAV